MRTETHLNPHVYSPSFLSEFIQNGNISKMFTKMFKNKISEKSIQLQGLAGRAVWRTISTL
jgi:hypothetical protein